MDFTLLIHLNIDLIAVAIQCLESSYGIDTSDEQTVAKYQVQKNLLDIFNAQLNIEVNAYCHNFQTESVGDCLSLRNLKLQKHLL